MTLETPHEISQIAAGDTGGMGESDTARQTLTNLRVTTQARDNANFIADALGMEQRATVEGILRVVRRAVEIERAINAAPGYLRRAILGKNYERNT